MADLGTRHPALDGDGLATHDEPAVRTTEAVPAPQAPSQPRREPPSVHPPALREPPAKVVGSEDSRALTPLRRVFIDGSEIDAAKDITVRGAETGPSYADITLWNLDVKTWSSVGKRKEIVVELGWKETYPETVFRGNVVTKRRWSRGGDREYTIRAVSRHGADLKREYSRAFNNLSPHRMVELIADFVGIEKGYISTASPRLSGYWATSRHRELRHWFDKLAGLAAEGTGEPWVWYLEDGQLHFHSVREQVTESVPISKGRSLVRASPVGAPRQSGLHPHELVMYCEPVIRRGTTVHVFDVASMPSGQRWRVSSYLFESSSTEGYHRTTAVVEPLADRDEIYGGDA